MWSDKELDDAFRRLAPPEPAPEPFPLDAWLRLETKLDKAAMERQFRQRLWRFFAGEMAVVAVAALIWLAWPTQPVAPATTKQRAAGPTAPAASKRHSHTATPATAVKQRTAKPAGTAATTHEPATDNAPAPPPNATQLGSKPGEISAQALAAATEMPAANSGKNIPSSGKTGSDGRIAGVGQAPASHLPPGQAAAADSVTAFASSRRHAVAVLAAAAKHHAPATPTASEKSAVRLSTANRKSAAINRPAHTPASVSMAGQKTAGRHQAGAAATIPSKQATAQARRHLGQNETAAVANSTSRKHSATTKPQPAHPAARGVAQPLPALNSSITSAPAAEQDAEPATAVAEMQPLTIALVALDHRLPSPLATLPVAPLAPLPEPLRQPRLYLGLVAAPDVSTVKMADFQPPTPNLGITLEYRLTNRLRVSTGLLRGTKNYRARRQDYDWSYYPSAATGNFEWVDGSCTILDVPLNLRYAMLARPHYQVLGSIGLSSLFMQHETYAYDVVYSGYQHHWQRSFTNENQHWFSVLNLSVGYERNLSRHWRLQAEPYVKLPLGGVGAGKVQLASGGVFFGVKYGF